MNEKNAAIEAMQSLNPKKVLVPVLFGLLGLAYIIFTNDELKWDDIMANLLNASPLWLFLAFFALFMRDFGYMYRIKHLTDNKLSWKSSFYTIVLWEFSSAITPSVVGGTAVAIFILNREGINMGKSLAIVWLTAVLDNLFYVLASVIIISMVPNSFPEFTLAMVGSDEAQPVKIIFVVSVALIGLYVILMGGGLFFAPKYVKGFLVWWTRFRWLKRFRRGAIQTGNDMILASKELQGMSANYWIKASLSTLFVWLARYLIVNCLIAAFADTTFSEHLLIFGRHLIMWIALLVSPTPGSSGVAEAFFPQFFGEFSGSFSVAVGIIWRLFTYYGYLAIGAIFLPRWIARVFSSKPKAA